MTSALLQLPLSMSRRKKQQRVVAIIDQLVRLLFGGHMLMPRDLSCLPGIVRHTLVALTSSADQHMSGLADFMLEDHPRFPLSMTQLVQRLQAGANVE